MKNAKTEETVKTPLKKSFETYWSESSVVMVDKLTYAQMAFFKHHYHTAKTTVWEMMHPDSIQFRDLALFRGKKTRVTIEVIE